MEHLKNALLREHARDKRLTFIAYGLIITIVVVLLVVFGRIVLTALLGADVPSYVRYVLAIALLSYVGYAVFNILKLNKRQEDIEDLFRQLQNGAKAVGITSVKEYRIIIPLGKITFNLFPVEFQLFTLDNNAFKSYKLPVPGAAKSDFFTYLSGVNVENVNEQLSELYAETPIANPSGGITSSFSQMQETESFEDTPMKTVDEYRTFLKTELKDVVANVDENRRKSQKFTLVFGVSAVLVVFGFMGYIFYNVFTAGASFSVTNVFIVMGVLFAAYYIVYFLYLKPKMSKEYGDTPTDVALHTPQYEFKTKILPRIIDFISPQATYVMHGHVDYAELIASGMFTDANYEITGNDMIVGRYRGVPYQFCDLNVEVKRRISRDDDDPTYAFCGQYFVARFNKSFVSPVYIMPRTGITGFFRDNSASVYIQGTGEKIQLEDPEFMKMFNVYGKDQIESRYILTPSLMERIKQLAIQTKGQYYISFYENRITVANNSGKNTLEMKSGKSLAANDYEVLVGFYNELKDEFSIIEDLKLNIKIWR